MSNLILSLFGCCGEKPAQRDRKTTKAILLGPTTTMNLQNPPNRPFNRLYQGSTAHGRNGMQFKEDLEDNLSSKSIIRVYPSNEVFILGNKYKIVAFITRKKIDKENSVQVSLRESLSSLVKENVRNNSNSNTSSKAKWSNLVKNCASIENKKDLSGKDDKLASSNASCNGNHESLGSYLANRLKCDVLVDAVCGFGEITKYFGGACNFVVAFEKDIEKLLSAKNLAETQELNHKIDFINADFMDVNGFQADVVFLDPVDIRAPLEQSFSIYEDLSPQLEHVLSKALKIARGSMVLKLPGDTSLEELPKLFYDAFKDEDMDFKRYCIEIEEIENTNQEVENIIVYFGDSSSIERKEEYGAIYDYLSSTQQPKWRFKFSLQVVTFILEKVGTRKSLQFISEIEEFAANHSTSQLPYSFFDIFIEKVIGENILSKQEVAQLIKEESKRPSSFIFSIANSYTSKFTLLDHSNSAVSSQYNLVETVEENRGKKEATKNNKGRIGNSVSEIHFEGFSQFHSQENTTQPPSHKDNQNKSSNFYNGYADKKPFSFKDLTYNGEGSMIPSCEVSHLENYLSSDDGEVVKELKENGNASLRVYGKSRGEITNLGNLTPEDIGLDSPALLPVYKKGSGKYSKSSKWKEFKSDSLVNEEVKFELVENKENDKRTRNQDYEVEKINKPDFFVKKKNVFLENGKKQGE